MADPVYTEHDLVLKQESLYQIMEECSLLGINLQKEESRKELRRSLEQARSEGADVLAKSLNLVAGWDETHEEYFIVVRDVYDPRNLVAVLFERIVAEDETVDVGTIIGRYLGVIEEKEKISLGEAKEKLVKLAADLKTALEIYEDDEYTEEELDRLSDSLDDGYFNPIAEVLEGILVTIAGN